MMTLRAKRSAGMALVLILAATVACRQPLPNTPPVSPAIPSTATASPAPQIEEFAQETLARYKGKVVLLNFWAIWCAPCRSELPDMEAIYRKYRDQGVVIVAVNVAESSKDIIAFAQKLELTFPILRDSEGKAMNAYRIRFLPTTLFLDQQGQTVFRKEGSLNQDSMSAQIEQLLH